MFAFESAINLDSLVLLGEASHCQIMQMSSDFHYEGYRYYYYPAYLYASD